MNCASERRDIPITRRAFTVNGEAADVIAIAMTLTDGEQLALGDLRSGEEIKTRDGRLVRRVR